MDLPLSKIQNTFSGKVYNIPKVNANILYICLQQDCGEQVVSDIIAEGLTGHYTGARFCAECGASLWKVIK